MEHRDTIAAVATGSGGAIAVIRLSGPDAAAIAGGVFAAASGRPLEGERGYTLHYGAIRDEAGSTVDDVVVALYRAPRSYTGEDMVEISCHASPYIKSEIMRLLGSHGARQAGPGEFTVRAFLAGKMDLAQADMIAAEGRAAHALASNQLRGSYSDAFGTLRAQLLELVSLLELELDFGEEDVEFADRSRLQQTMEAIGTRIAGLGRSFRLGNTIRGGVPVAIAGRPNVGKSTLLNTLLGDDRAMVSDIAGTTRDVIEDTVNLDGVTFRFIDTAGIRRTDDVLEGMGIERTFDRIARAAVVLYLVDPTETGVTSRGAAGNSIEKPVGTAGTEQAAGAGRKDTMPDAAMIAETVGELGLREEQQCAIVVNKADRVTDADALARWADELRQFSGREVIVLSARQGMNIGGLIRFLVGTVETEKVYSGDPIVANTRHHEALTRAGEALARAQAGLRDGLAGDLLAQDIRQVLHHLGEITGEITTDDVLGEIFSKFCVGK